MFAVKLLNNREKTCMKHNKIVLVSRHCHFSNLTPTEIHHFTTTLFTVPSSYFTMLMPLVGDLIRWPLTV